jgi:hypothetical protein
VAVIAQDGVRLRLAQGPLLKLDWVGDPGSDLPKGNGPNNRPSKIAHPKDAPFKEALPKEALTKDVPPKQAPPKDVPSKDASSKDTSTTDPQPPQGDPR